MRDLIAVKAVLFASIVAPAVPAKADCRFDLDRCTRALDKMYAQAARFNAINDSSYAKMQTSAESAENMVAFMEEYLELRVVTSELYRDSLVALKCYGIQIEEHMRANPPQ